MAVSGRVTPTRSGMAGPRTMASTRASVPAIRARRIRLAVRAEQQQPGPVGSRSGPTGLNVASMRPTSPGAWAIMSAALREANLRMLAPQELPWVKEKGAIVVDVRPEDSFAEGHLPGASNVPFYRSIDGWTPWQMARRVGFALFGVAKGTEPNPNFVSDVRSLVADPATTPVVLYCNMGGSLEPTKNDRNGQQTRSMIAAYELVQAGFKAVHVLKGGFGEWNSNGREVEALVTADATEKST
ncbi:hypothetical protein HYH03_002535 [Edaphochlamys debaryana]|uniref:Rhodanese domain-containing protein n=1 Tax=Edaphochlamys debaryana TaxID=47281 RepID=A0A835YKY8_9CHLO|nr:hypothetical protein HYH03_002535 [Edaphochlamys debaryana]|eukprot:KAG2499594.1 hypothetical protein HYH03_002535 [Edaphochlamys debaryana]